MSSAPRIRTRHPVLAVVLSLVATPVSAMCYLGRGQRAFSYALIFFACPYFAYKTAAAGLWPGNVSWVILYLLLALVGAADAYRLSLPHRERFVGPWFSTWQGMAGIGIVYLVAVVGVRASLFEPFRIPAASMLPTLAVGDHFFANKFVYGLRLPFTSVELSDGEAPARGDVIVFWPANQRVRYVKRIVGVPGDLVSIDPASMEVSVNGESIRLAVTESAEFESGTELATEKLGNREFQTLTQAGSRSRGGDFSVPEGHYFVLGDNRDNSMDSRYPEIGFVPEDNIIGRAGRIWWNTSSPDRVGKPL